MDSPNKRKVHKKVIPLLGGLAIYISFVLGILIIRPFNEDLGVILAGATIIMITGVIDDIFEIKARWKLLGQMIAAATVIFGGVYVEFINLPFDGTLELGVFGIPLTFLWIVGVTNAINLIDGLDGLAAGVSSIVLVTIATIAMLDGNIFIVTLASLLLASTLGFLVHNFYPAKIFMGDTGALFLGYMIAVISLLGFKSVTLFSLIIPVIILGVPISDTLFAIIRRIVNKQPLASPDKSHLHHCLLRLGYSHRTTVLIIYGISTFFALSAMILTQSTLWGALLITALLILVVEFIVEMVGLVSGEYRPMLNFIDRISNLKNYDNYR